MRKADVAEKFLSLATTPDRAGNIAGDLSEDAARRGLAWFWCSLMKITSSLVWRAWTDQPARMLRLGAGGFLLSNGLVFALSIVLALLATAIDALNWAPFASFGSIWCSTAPLALTGRWLAWRAPGRELPACTAFVFIDTLFWASLFIFLLSVRVPGMELQDVLLIPVMNFAFLFLGVEHHRAQHSVLG